MLSFLFVLSTVHEDVWKVLKRYSSMLVVQVIPWALPGHLPNDPETRSQFLHAETWQRRRLEVRYHSRFFYASWPQMNFYILEISFSFHYMYHVIVRPTKIISNLLKDCKILTSKVIFRIKNQINPLSEFYSL
jgi:hypothetical protein